MSETQKPGEGACVGSRASEHPALVKTQTRVWDRLIRKKGRKDGGINYRWGRRKFSPRKSERKDLIPFIRRVTKKSKQK